MRGDTTAPGAGWSREHRRSLAKAADQRDVVVHQWRIEAGAVDAVPASFVVDDFLREEEPQHLDLLFDPTSPVTELLAQRLVLDVVPAKADAEARPALRKDIDFRGLLRDEHGLA